MRVYGLRIGSSGIEFCSREEREKALVTFTKGSSVTVRNSDIRYKAAEAAFGTYERETNEVMANCCQCNGVFSLDVCPKREYPYKYYGKTEWSTSEGHICDACLVKAQKEKEIDEAKQTLKTAQVAV